MWQRLKLYAALTLAVVLAALAVYYRLQAGNVTRVWSAPAVIQQIRPLHELVTVRYDLQKVIGFKEEKVPFGSESVLLMVQAVVKAGVNLKTLREDDVTLSVDRQEIALRLPAAEITDVYINDKETQVWDRSKTWWTPWVAANPQLEQNARQAALEAIQSAALQAGILSNAQKNAETSLRSFLRSAGFRDVTFLPRRRGPPSAD